MTAFGRAICTVAVLGIWAACSSTKGGPSGSPSDGSGSPSDGSGSPSDGGGPDDRDNCVVDLSAIADHDCPASFEDAMASEPCGPFQNPNYPMSGMCGGFLVFSFGHDGHATCVYDPSTHALVGGTVCGIPPFYSASCPCTNAGTSPVSCAAGDLTALCTMDAGSAAGD